MMTGYTEYTFSIQNPDVWRDILIAYLADEGFDSFNEIPDGLLAYFKGLFTTDQMDAIVSHFPDGEVILERSAPMPDVNWNAEWEKNFPPILVEDKIRIRAEFHEPLPEYEEIIIQPKMSFGTGHHATTYLMISQMDDMDFQDKKVLDMGCGTSVLAIFAKKRGADYVLGIDIDPWSVENSIENAERNGVALDIRQGTSENLGNETFDIILANINRNILIHDIPVYAQHLNQGGYLLLSGLCYFDEEDILKICEQQKLSLIQKKQREEWICLLLQL